jgi:phosphomannomutase
MDTPISFGTDGWRATLDEFTSPRVQIVGQAVADYLREVEDREGETVAVSYDARETSRGFAEDLCRVLAANGFDVLIPERDTPTPILAWTLVDRDLAGGLMITASHNPPEYNGVKFIPSDGAPALPEVTDEIMARLAEPDPLPESEHGRVSEEDFVAPYADHAFDLVDSDFEDLSVVYDAMHGSGRGVTDELLEEAGASVECLRCERDPEFGGSSPEPSEENLQELIAAVEDGDADIGIANDGDADRIAVVTPERGFLDENLFFAALYEYLLEDDSRFEPSRPRSSSTASPTHTTRRFTKRRSGSSGSHRPSRNTTRSSAARRAAGSRFAATSARRTAFSWRSSPPQSRTNAPSTTGWTTCSPSSARFTRTRPVSTARTTKRNASSPTSKSNCPTRLRATTWPTW